MFSDRIKSRPALLLAAACAGLFAPAAALAQGVESGEQAAPDTSGCERLSPFAERRLAVSSCVLSTLAADDPTDGRAHYQDYRLLLREDQVVRIRLDSLPVAIPTRVPGATRMRAYGFDTYLEVRRGDDRNDAEPLAVNDDRPGSLNSELVFAAPARGEYVVRARALGAGQGDFVLRVLAAPSQRPQVRVEGDVIAGRLEIDGSSRDSWVLEGHAGERVRLTTDKRDLHFELLGSSGGTIASGHPAGGNLAHLVAVLPRHDLYTVRVAGESAHQTIPFTIRIARARAPTGERPEPVEVGQAVNGELTIASPGQGLDPDVGAEDFFYELHELRAAPDRPLTITLDAIDEFLDPVLDVGTMTPLGLSVLFNDDDGGEVWNSRLVVPAGHPETLIIRVRSFGLGIGRYRLTVAERAIPPPAAASR